MMLALRKTPSRSATWWQRLFARLTQIRLVSDYSHGGIIIDGMLYHMTRDGLHASEWEPAKWDVYDVLGSDETALLLFDLWQHVLAAALKPARESAGVKKPARKDES